MQYSKSATGQRGVALIVSLIVLAAMTILGLSSIRSTSVQQLIIKNMQFLTAAQHIARTEINGQLDIINLNEPDPLILDLLTTPVNDVADTTGTKTDSAGLAYEQTAFDQKTTITMICSDCPAPIGGFSFGFGISALVGTIDSEASMNNSAASSSQEQGFWYLKP
jgi:hypothetical protein